MRHEVRGADAPVPPYLAIEDRTPEGFRAVLDKAEWKNVKYVNKDVWVKIKDAKRSATIAWTFLSTQDDEDK